MLTAIIEFVHQALDKNAEIMSEPIDISKEFDRFDMLVFSTSSTDTVLRDAFFQSFITSRVIMVALNKHASRRFYTNVGTPHRALSLERSCFWCHQIPTSWHNYLPLADNTTTYSCHRNMSCSFNKVWQIQQSKHSNCSRKSEVNWGKKWLVYFTAFKTKLLWFNH